MNIEDIRVRARTSPEWLAVEMMKRIEELEAIVAELSKRPKRGRPKKVDNGTNNVRRVKDSNPN